MWIAIANNWGQPLGEVSLDTVTELDAYARPRDEEALTPITQDMRIVAVCKDPISDNPLPYANNAGILATVPNDVHTLHGFEVGMSRVYCEEWGPYVTLASLPLNLQATKLLTLDAHSHHHAFIW